jgi:hypothetical protein
MGKDVMDPLAFVAQWALKAPIDLPLSSETDYARDALGALASVLYDCPLFETLKTRDRRKFVRTWLSNVLSDTRLYGFIPSIVNWSKLGHAFLTSFRKRGTRGTELTFEPAADLAKSPLHLAILKLQDMTVEHPDFFKHVRWIYNWHVFLAKIPLTRPDLVGPAETTWVTNQVEVLNREYPPLYITKPLRATITWLFDESLLTDVISGKHGPGSTSGGWKLIHEKEANFKPTLQTNQIVNHPSTHGLSTLLARPRDAVVKIVKKDAKSVRVITMAPPENMYAQQAVKRAIYKIVDDDRVVNASRFVSFDSQTRSQDLAVEGSKPGLDDSKPITIDLKSASDTLSSDLVTAIFSGNFLHLIMSGRAWQAEVDDSIQEFGMYDGMGSALTFPVQTLVFTAIAVLGTCISLYRKDYGLVPEDLIICLREYLRPDGYARAGSNIAHYFKNVQVFGDDIIIPAIATSDVLKLLKMSGLTTNEDKSFFAADAVREACGIFALWGQDITPVRFTPPVTNDGGLLDYAAFEGWRSLTNFAFIHNFPTLYRFGVRKLKTSKMLVAQHTPKKRNGKLKESKARREFQLAKPELLFEDYGGDIPYLGIISNRGVTRGESRAVFGERRTCVLTYHPRLKTKRDKESDLYHLEQAYYHMSVTDTQVEAHGRIPRGIRLDKRYAYRASSHGHDETPWAWVPKVRMYRKIR